MLFHPRPDPLLLLSTLVLVLFISTSASMWDTAAAQTPPRPQVGGPAVSVDVPPAAAADLDFAHLYLIRATSAPTPWWQTSTVVDAAGGVHTAFYTSQSILYAYCPDACDDPAHWSETPLAAAGAYDSLSYPTLALDADNRPRMMWFHQPDYVYAECNANCTNAASWTAVPVPVASTAVSFLYPQTAHYFALDSQGRPRFVCYGSDYDDQGNSYMGFAYTTCDGGCTHAANWHSALVDLQEYLAWPQLVMNPQDQPRVVGVGMDDQLVYLGCNANCAQSENWGRTTLYEVGYYGNYAFRLDAQGRPRLAFYRGNVDDPRLYYAWSNATAIAATQWFSASLDLPPNDERTVDLALDSHNRPHVVFGSAQENLDSATCTANCESTAGTWQVQHVETGDELDVADPIPAGPTCTASVWMLLGYPSLALDAADRPSVSYYAQHARMCLGSDGQYHILHDVWALRIATVGGAATCYTLAMSADPAAGGEVSATPGSNCAGGKYTAGTQVQLHAAPAANYRFDRWSGDGAGSANPTTLTLSADKSVTAHFAATAGDGHKVFLPTVVD